MEKNKFQGALISTDSPLLVIITSISTKLVQPVFSSTVVCRCFHSNQDCSSYVRFLRCGDWHNWKLLFEDEQHYWLLFEFAYLQIRGVCSVIFISFLHENIYCGYSLEAPRWGASNEYPQYMFSWRNKINIVLFWLKTKQNNNQNRKLI